MKIGKAVNRFTWRLTEGGFKGNQLDEDAINAIIEYVNTTQKQTANNHELLVKLFIEVWRRTLKIQKKKVFDKEATRWVLEAFELSVSNHIEMFTNELNEQEMTLKMDELGINNNQHPVIFKGNNPEGQKKEMKLMEDNYKDILKPEWDVETVEYLIVSSVNHIIQKFQ